MSDTQGFNWTVQSRKTQLINYIVPVSIGIYDYEKSARQRVCISVSIDLTPIQHVGQDHIHSVLDYDFLRNGIDQLIATQHFELQETLCEHILQLCFSKTPVVGATVKTSKLDVYENCESIGIEISAVRKSVKA